MAEDRSVTYTIDFPLEQTHYIILRGVPAFRGIYIYGMSYRTDPRFETYNSSGYVYKFDTNALLLKSRHKSELETVRLVYKAETPKTEEVTETASSENGTSGSVSDGSAAENGENAGAETGGTGSSSLTPMNLH